MTLSDEAHIYWRSCRGMRHGNDAIRPIAAWNLIQLGSRGDETPVVTRARRQINEAGGVLAAFDAA